MRGVLRPAVRASSALGATRIEAADLLQRVRENLTDKILLCWCKPKDCHGDIYVEICDAPSVTAADGTVVR